MELLNPAEAIAPEPTAPARSTASPSVPRANTSSAAAAPASGASPTAARSKPAALGRSKSIVELAKQVSEEDLRAAQQLFGIVDANHDGAISQEELAKV